MIDQHILALTQRLLSLPGSDLLFAPASHYESLLAAMCQRILALEALPTPQNESDPAGETTGNAPFSPDLFRQNTPVSHSVFHNSHSPHHLTAWEASQHHAEALSPGQSITPSAAPLGMTMPASTTRSWRTASACATRPLPTCCGWNSAVPMQPKPKAKRATRWVR